MLLAIPYIGLPRAETLPSIAVALMLSAIVGALARGVAGAAWFALAAGVPLLLPLPKSNGLVVKVVGGLAIAAAAAVLAVTQRRTSQG